MTSANKLSAGNEGRKKKKRENNLHVCAPTSSRQRSRLGNNPFGSLMMPRLRLREKNNWGLIIEDQLDGTVPHSGGSSCVAPSVSCRSIAGRMKQRFVRTSNPDMESWGSRLHARLCARSSPTSCSFIFSILMALNYISMC